MNARAPPMTLKVLAARAQRSVGRDYEASEATGTATAVATAVSTATATATVATTTAWTAAGDGFRTRNQQD